jgi:hypothetical protein
VTGWLGCGNGSLASRQAKQKTHPLTTETSNTTPPHPNPPKKKPASTTETSNPCPTLKKTPKKSRQAYCMIAGDRLGVAPVREKINKKTKKRKQNCRMIKN